MTNLTNNNRKHSQAKWKSLYYSIVIKSTFTLIKYIRLHHVKTVIGIELKYLVGIRCA